MWPLESLVASFTLAAKWPTPTSPPTFGLLTSRSRENGLPCLHRRSSIDRGVIQQCFKERQYDLPAGFYTEFMQRTYEQILVAGRQPLIVDCGANIGASVLLFATRYPRAHILAINRHPIILIFLAATAPVST